jgi:hypothetical protein
MNSTEVSWLENRVSAAVADDFYMDRAEEKGIKEEASSKGFPIADIEVILRSVLERFGAVSERQLVDTLDHWLHQFTDNDKKLDAKEERDALDKVVRSATGKKKGMDPRIAEEYVASFCKVNGITRTTDKNKLTVPVVILAVLAVLGIGAYLFSQNKPQVRTEQTGVILAPVASAQLPVASAQLSDVDRAEIDDQLRRAAQFVTASQFTDPPEKSAKACLDNIRRIDPGTQYKANEIRKLVSTIVTQYIEMADKSYSQNDKNGTQRWLNRAKLFHADSELIREKERVFGYIPAENR